MGILCARYPSSFLYRSTLTKTQGLPPTLQFWFPAKGSFCFPHFPYKSDSEKPAFQYPKRSSLGILLPVESASHCGTPPHSLELAPIPAWTPFAPEAVPSEGCPLHGHSTGLCGPPPLHRAHLALLHIMKALGLLRMGKVKG